MILNFPTKQQDYWIILNYSYDTQLYEITFAISINQKKFTITNKKAKLVMQKLAIWKDQQMC